MRLILQKSVVGKHALRTSLPARGVGNWENRAKDVECAHFFCARLNIRKLGAPDLATTISGQPSPSRSPAAMP